MDEDELRDWEEHLEAAGLGTELTDEIRRLQALLSPPVSGKTVTAGVTKRGRVRIREQAPVGEGQIGEPWTGEVAGERMAFKITNKILTDYVATMGATVEPSTMRLVGIRGAVPYAQIRGLSISLRENVLDHWNDTLGIWGSAWGLNVATCDPGRYYTDYPMNPQGAAHLLGLEQGGKPWRFQWGTHQGAYEALIQAEAFSVRRDTDRDGVPEQGEPVQTGQFGIHVHWGGAGWSVGKWSAGCQVLFGGEGPESPWQTFKATLKSSGQPQFTYYLIDGYKLAKWMGLV